uniref:S-layer homology domain-containing protein n=1 Tax=uncultured Veillonella sp. TaxID=159268 RepID=UPI00260915E4
DIVSGRGATEDQLKTVSDAIKSVTNGTGPNATGGFALAGENKDANGKLIEAKQDLGKAIQVKGGVTEGTVTSENTTGSSNITTKVNNGALEISLNKDIDLGSAGSVKTGNTIINNAGVTADTLKAGETIINNAGVDTNKVTTGEIAIKGSDISITKDGIKAGNTQITDVASGGDKNADGTYKTDSKGNQVYSDAANTNAANIGDVKNIAGSEATKAADAVRAQSGKNITVDPTTNTVNLNDSITLGEGNRAITIDGKDTGTITVGGQAGITVGNQSTQAIDDSGNAVGAPQTGHYVTGLSNTTWNPSEAGIVPGRAATESQLKVIDDKLNGGRVFAGDTGNVTVALGESLNVTGGATDTAKLTDGNLGVVAEGNTLAIKLAQNIDLGSEGSIAIGNTTINGDGVSLTEGPSITRDGIDAGGNRITSVAPGAVEEGSTDAINGGQLFETNQAVNAIGGAVSKLGNRINRVGAASAALAALHPLDFNPDDKWDFAAGYGNYRGANAAAVGAYYRPNEDTMFSLGGSFGGGENMVNAGVSFKLGQSSGVNNSKVALAKDVQALKEIVKAQSEQLQAQSAEIEQLKRGSVPIGTMPNEMANVNFSDLPQNHWAYGYVKSLADRGLLKGYPDGEFKGDRNLTRYEFAAALYRALQNGAPMDRDMLKGIQEFNSEITLLSNLDHSRVDRVSGEDDDRNKVERVRINNEDDTVNKVFRDVYGGKIQKDQ